MKTSKIRISVPIAPELALAIEYEAKKIGVSEATYCAFIIGQYISTQSKVYSLINDKVVTLMQDIEEEEIKEIIKNNV